MPAPIANPGVHKGVKLCLLLANGSFIYTSYISMHRFQPHLPSLTRHAKDVPVLFSLWMLKEH